LELPVPDDFVDYYEILQISPNAHPDTVHRIYRLLAQQLHPDNSDTGNPEQFRQLTEAYHVLSHPERRAQYDVGYTRARQDRWRLVSSATDADSDLAAEQRLRLTVLQVLYARRRIDPQNAGLSPWDLETLIGLTGEQLEFVVWYLVQKKFVTKSDSSALMVTVEGVDYLESRTAEKQPQRRLAAASGL
jgi:curved DNA-binding protein CbpA